MGLAATGLIIPGITGGQIKKLSNVLIKKGWRETKGRIFDPQGVEYIRNKEGKLQSLSSYKQTQAVEKRIEENKSKAKARSNQQKKVIKEHNEEAEKFRLRTGLDYSLENHQLQDIRCHKRKQTYSPKKLFPSLFKLIMN